MSRRQRWRWWAAAIIGTMVLSIALAISPPSVFGENAAGPLVPVDSLSAIQPRLSNPRPHNLPAQLSRACRSIAASESSGPGNASANLTTYFDAIRPLPVGYLLWTTFPISVYVEPLIDAHDALTALWQDAAASALQDWGRYLPIEVVSHPDAAIQLRPVMPPLRYGADGTLRAQAGDASYSFYLDPSEDTQILRHRFTVLVKPGQASRQLEASIRHELGHALGLWGHSREPNDALYYSQVRDPSPVSLRDVATLCQVYRQPTAMGWPLTPTEASAEP